MPADPILKELYPDPVAFTQPALSAEDTFIDKVSSALEEQEIDFDSLTEQEKDEVIEAALEQEQAEPQEAGAPEAGAPEAEATKEAEAKFVEADTMGRVMAHSFNQELGEIELEKDSASATSKEVARAKDIMSAAKQKNRPMLSRAGRVGSKAYQSAKGVAGKGVAAGGRAASAVGRHLAKRKAPYLAGAGALAAGLGGGYALGKKSADAEFEAAVSNATAERLAEVLTDMGVDPDQI